MDVQNGSLTDRGAIAEVYMAAFPESVQFFFPHKPQGKLTSLVTSGFALLLLTKRRVLVARNVNGQTVGYCVYSRPVPGRRKAAPWDIVRSVISHGCTALLSLSLSELGRLMSTRWRFITSARRKWKPPQEGGRIVSIAVHPEAQGQGIGEALLQSALQELAGRTVYLEVRTTNTAAQSLYHKHGFQVYGETRDLQGEWLMMVRPSP